MGKLIDQRVKAADFVASAVDTHNEKIASAFRERFAKYAKPGEHVDIASVVNVLARALRANGTALQSAMDDYDRELGDDDEPRARRDTELAALIEELTSFRGAVNTTFGAATVTKLGFSGKTPDNAEATLGLARQIRKTVDDPKFHWPKPVRRGLRIDAEEWLAPIEKHAKALTTAIKDVIREKREADAAFTTREKARMQHDGDFGHIASLLSDLMTLVGESELAERVRPSTRRAGTTAASEPPADDPPGPGDTSK